MSSERVNELVRRHIEALGVGRVDIAAIPQDESGRPRVHRDRGLQGVLRLIPWLRARNARGDHIYTRCGAGSGVILLDDLTVDSVDRMRTDGISPAAVVETSPGSIQSWIRISCADDPRVSRAVCALLTDRYGGDPQAVGSGRWGRLAGFLNRKPQHTQPGGRFPWVALLQATGEAVPEAVAEALIREARAGLAARPTRPPAAASANPVPAAPGGVAPGLERLLGSVRRLRRTGDGRWEGCCPAHDDQHPSLSIRVAEGGPHPGSVLVHCRAGCGWKDVVAAAGVKPHELFPQQRGEGRS